MGDSGVTLAVEAKAKPGAKKRAPVPREVPWAELGTGRVQVEFGRVGPGEAGAEDDRTPDAVSEDDGPGDDGGEQ